MNNTNRLLVTILVLIIVLIGVGWFLAAKGMLPGINSTASSSGTSDYTAVFLSNGQVYFGKMSNGNDQYVTLKDIFYIQVQSTGDQSQSQAQNSDQQQQISLVKLGNELHGPEDSMQINRDHIIFRERIKTDSKVVQAIDQYKKNGPQPAPSPTASTAPTASPKK